MKKIGNSWKWILAIVLLLVIARASLPYAIKYAVNRQLDSIPGYYGHIDDVDVAIIRGAFGIEGLKLLKTNGDAREPFFAARDIDIGVDWKALWNGKIRVKVDVARPELQFIQRETKEASQTTIDKSWQEKLKAITRFEVNRVTIRDGLVRYRDVTADPKINIYIQDLNVVASNISNIEDKNVELPSKLELSAKVQESGVLNVNAAFNLLSEPLVGDMTLSLRDFQLRDLNSFTKTYGKFDFEKGTLRVSTEIAASKTRYEGYAKTLLRGVDVLDLQKEFKEGDNPVKAVWEGIVGAVAEIFQNQKRDQFAARIPISGSRAEVNIGSLETLGTILKNAYIQALSPKFEDSVDFEDAEKKQR